MKEIYGLGRSRDKKGNIVGRHLNPYMNCIHTWAGGGENLKMAILVIEIEDEDGQVNSSRTDAE